MTLTIKFGLWMVPLLITILGCVAIVWVGFKERNATGYLSGMGTALVTLLAIIVSAASWITWLMTFFFR